MEIVNSLIDLFDTYTMFITPRIHKKKSTGHFDVKQWYLLFLTDLYIYHNVSTIYLSIVGYCLKEDHCTDISSSYLFTLPDHSIKHK